MFFCPHGHGDPFCERRIGRLSPCGFDPPVPKPEKERMRCFCMLPCKTAYALVFFGASPPFLTRSFILSSCNFRSWDMTAPFLPSPFAAVKPFCASGKTRPHRANSASNEHARGRMGAFFKSPNPFRKRIKYEKEPR